MAAKNKVAMTGFKFMLPVQLADHVWPGNYYRRLSIGVRKQPMGKDRKW